MLDRRRTAFSRVVSRACIVTSLPELPEAPSMPCCISWVVSAACICTASLSRRVQQSMPDMQQYPNHRSSYRLVGLGHSTLRPEGPQGASQKQRTSPSHCSQTRATRRADCLHRPLDLHALLGRLLVTTGGCRKLTPMRSQEAALDRSLSPAFALVVQPGPGSMSQRCSCLCTPFFLGRHGDDGRGKFKRRKAHRIFLHQS